ncbi:type II secretion system protein [Fructilactobacillus fructivorans]|uniref:Prepilin-type N-terminal cleavage/methylation domain-containing protein n=1 Tax=Fructilactobacillus fructivorans TaxID=1614 RepID=A0AAE6TX17_9LACO|nr:type II secretion system protein [Fructilactobacillus fructivorans]KRK57881.1 hypothetical protein FC73_GL000891 [Fructilactobacillus fructivorans]KRN12576.1 hypothetical protein IV37_GL000873 [Fructilactobacillus fructivorans]QFX92848.1 prepilin-type N-terminal cleavage/methylation domain-containing protein [Fructilactobacillus fructivorans]RDV65552.1 type II secretion system protein [Fructilactobacillus fructivorans]
MRCKNDQPGFTLVESVLVLFVSSLILGITLVAFNYLGVIGNQEKRFFETLDSAWNEALIESQAHHHSTRVLFYPNDEVVFVKQEKSRLKNRVVKMPRGLSVKSYHDIEIKKDGYVKPQTIRWSSSGQKRLILQKIQLGWGAYHLETIKQN